MLIEKAVNFNRNAQLDKIYYAFMYVQNLETKVKPGGDMDYNKGGSALEDLNISILKCRAVLGGFPYTIA